LAESRIEEEKGKFEKQQLKKHTQKQQSIFMFLFGWAIVRM